MNLGRNRQRLRARFLGGTGGGAVNLLSSVQSDGWQGVWASGTPPTFDPDGAPVYQTFTRQGYDATATAITFDEDIPILRRVREPYPNQLTDTASNVAMGDYILSTDSAAGVTNSSTEISPKPIANWVMRDRQLVGDTIDWEIVAFHYYARNGRQVAAVRVRANDGTNQTPWQVVSSTAVSTYCEDANAVEVYRGTLTLTALADGAAATPTLCWLEAEVMPWVGATASVLRSEDSAVPREFSRRYFARSTARAGSPPLAYVSSTGVDATGVWSRTSATAEATPFLTVAGALAAVNVGAGNIAETNSILDGNRIRIVNTVNAGTAATARPQQVASVIVERAPATARSAAIVTLAANFRPRLGVGTLLGGLTEGAITFFDVTVSRTGASTFFGETANPLQVHLHNMTYSCASATNFLANSAHSYFYGVTMTGTTPSLGVITGFEKRLNRGLAADMNNLSLENFVTVGSTITRVNGATYSDETKPIIGYSNKWLNPTSTTSVINFFSNTNGVLLGPIAWVQNLIEVLHTTDTTPSIRISSDSPQSGSLTHGVLHHNTVTGFGSVARYNIIYDESVAAKSPPHKFMSLVGELVCQINNKGDIFELDGTRLAAFAFTHGTGCRGNFTQFKVNSGTQWSEDQTYPGLNASIGTSTTLRNNPLFVNYQGTGTETGPTGPTLGSGGGNYNLQAGSPALNRVVNKTLTYAIDGNLRATIASAGAYP